MYRYLPIRLVHAREILDSRSNPTIEVEVTVGEGIIGTEGYTGRAIVPSGASTGSHEAVELRDGEKRYNGLGVQEAVKNVNLYLSEKILGENALNQAYIDKLLLEEDGSPNKSKMGANAILGVSMAVADACAKALRLPLFQYLGGVGSKYMPVPMMNIMNGGKHADNTIDFQEFMIMPVKAIHFREALQIGSEIYHSLKGILKDKNMFTGVGDEGGFAPDISSTEEALDYMVHAIENAGYKPGVDVCIALDVAASELYKKEKNMYYFPGASKMTGKEVWKTADEMISYYEELVAKYPIVSIEDGLHEEDWRGWKKMTACLGKTTQLVGDDLFVTNKERLEYGIKSKAANSILIKMNQIGTLTETLDAIKTAHTHGYKTIISHRSGETEDTFIADLAVACNAGQIKTGAPCRTDRTAKYNQLVRIEEQLGQIAKYENLFC